MRGSGGLDYLEGDGWVDDGMTVSPKHVVNLDFADRSESLLCALGFSLLCGQA